MSKYDPKYGLFLQPTDYEIRYESSYPDLQFREVLGDDGKHVIVPIGQLIREAFGNKSIASSDDPFIHEFKKSSHPYLVEFSRKTGRLFLGYDCHLFVFEKENLFALLTQNENAKGKSIKELCNYFNEVSLMLFFCTFFREKNQ